MTFTVAQKVIVTLFPGYKVRGTVIRDFGETVYVHIGSHNYEYDKKDVQPA